MRKLDRLILALLTIGVWALVALVAMGYRSAAEITPEDVAGLEDFVEEVVEGCSVIGGDVLVYIVINHITGRGHIESGDIDC